MWIIRGLEITIIITGMKWTQLIKEMREYKVCREIIIRVVTVINRWARYKGEG